MLLDNITQTLSVCVLVYYCTGANHFFECSLIDWGGGGVGSSVPTTTDKCKEIWLWYCMAMKRRIYPSEEMSFFIDTLKRQIEIINFDWKPKTNKIISIKTVVFYTHTFRTLQHACIMLQCRYLEQNIGGAWLTALCVC